MSPSSLRVLSGAAAAVLALLTAIAVGFVGRGTECEPGTAPPPTVATSAAATPQTSAPASPSGDRTLGGGLGREPEDKQTGEPEKGSAASPTVAAPAGTERVVVVAPVCEQAPFAGGAALTALAGAGLTGAVLVALLWLGASRTRGAIPPGPMAIPGPAVVPPPGPGMPPAGAAMPPAGNVPRLDADRKTLVRACIYVRDRVTSRALSDRLAAALHEAGVASIEPVGDRFDPALHEAGGVTVPTDPALTGTIAAVEVPGYVDRGGRVLRPPIVTVYQPAAAGRTTPARPAKEDR